MTTLMNEAPSFSLAGRSALVTASGRGLGQAIALALAHAGADVALGLRDSRSGADTVDAIEALGRRAVRLQMDMTSLAEIRDAVEQAANAFGGLDILVNNVGLARGSDIVGTSDAEWTEALDQTLFPAIRASRLAVPHLRRRGGGAIIMIASIWGRESGGRMTYNAVKAAEISLGKAMAQQLAADNIRVNSVAPGSIRFPGGSWDRRVAEDPDGMREFVRRELPFGRFGRPEEVGAAVAFLASSRASWISGASVPVDGCQSRSLI
jgi:3-oxoacyl-[acyl-carrier protein] reductase